MYGPLGHIDFYPNDGLHQPGCDDLLGLESGISDLIRGGCSHREVNEVFFCTVWYI